MTHRKRRFLKTILCLNMSGRLGFLLHPRELAEQSIFSLQNLQNQNWRGSERSSGINSYKIRDSFCNSPNVQWPSSRLFHVSQSLEAFFLQAYSFYQTDLIGRHLFLMVNQNLSASVILLFLNLQLKTKRVSPHFFSLILPYGHFSGMLSNYTDLPFLFLPTIFNLFFRSVHSVPLCGPY